MALEITGTIELDNGLTLSSCYGRTQYRVNDSSNEVVILTQYWVDEPSYTTGKSPLSVKIGVGGRYDYDRATDGVDVLDFTNLKIKSELENLGFSVVITEL